MAMTVTAKIPESEHDDERDRALLRAVAARDQRALEQLYRLYRRPLLHFLARLQPDRDSAEEAINDAFWVIWRQAHSFRGASRVSTWITGIAWRCALSVYRRNSAAPRGATQVQFGRAAEELAAEPSLLEERAEWLDRGLSSLPFEQRATLELAYYLGHSCAEIAEIMQCPINTVKARMFQARIKLRNLLPGLGGLDAAIAAAAEPQSPPGG
ncbi:MAG TPA: sigma-70 family RNA polymerase sigma factor [Steroidobacteraceae bacterium]|nr:sigma-70 family RNA polymerase sigma factor [Steroidobacteraceae bacterium]